jgi:imidazoleglycerol phosphate dehydratase HisB
MYAGFDAMVLPRRYAGLCLPMNEALMSALPVFMTDISPNDHILPKEWLIKSSSLGTFRTKVRIELFEADTVALAETIDNYVNSDNKIIKKEKAFELGYNNFAPDKLKDSYLDIISHI